MTNGYQQLDAGLGAARSELLDTWCQRFERVQALISQKRPRDPEDCCRYLNDPQIRMYMTVQQMVF